MLVLTQNVVGLIIGDATSKYFRVSLTRLLYHNADAPTGKINRKMFADFILYLGFVCQLRLL